MTKSLPLFILFASFSVTLACSRGDSRSDEPGTNGGHDDQASGDQALIQGTWETTRLVTAGEELPLDAMAKGITVTFEGDKMITKRYGDVKATWVYTLDPTKNPKQMAINRAEAGESEKLSFLIYKIEDDTLTTLSGSRDFPEGFTRDTEKGCFLTSRRRIPANAVGLAMEDKLHLDMVSLTPRSGNWVRVVFKVTNVAAMDVIRAKATIVVLDAADAEIGSESHYVVKSGAGGLAPGASVEDDVLVTVSNPEQASSVRFKLESVRGG